MAETEKVNKIYYSVKREDWNQYIDQHPDLDRLVLNEEDLQRVMSVNDVLSLKDSKEIYEPITHLIDLYYRNYKQGLKRRNQFLDLPSPSVPFILGIAGSVAVGKSTIARLLQLFLKQLYPQKKISLVTTDNFLYPNAYLEDHDLMAHKGFPETYDMERLRQFMMDVKSGKEEMEIPIYSHSRYDILSDKTQHIEKPDILILEGINVLQYSRQSNLYLSSYFDLSIYVDAEISNIRQWYLDRFEILLEKATDPSDYYYYYAQQPREEIMALARQTWDEINLPNLIAYILPTREQSDLIIHKSENHRIDKILVKKY